MSSNPLSDVYPGSDLHWACSTPIQAGRLRGIGIILLAVILVITGSYIRTRPAGEHETADWLVMTQLVLCLAAGFVGVLLIRKHSMGGSGARRLIAYLLAAIVSSLFSSYPNLVVGYWILLAGTSVLCIGLISSSPTAIALRRLEAVILATLSLMIVKDTVINLFFLEASDTEELYRLGEGATNANSLGLTAALAFCMSLGVPVAAVSDRRQSVGAHRAPLQRISWFALRGLFVAVILLTRSRVSLIGLLIAFLVQLWFRKRQSAEIRSHVLLAAIPCCIGSLIMVATMSWTMELPAVTALVDFVNRGEDADRIMSITGRTEIWPYAIQRICEGTTSLLFGHGYGVSKEVLNENNWTVSFTAYHSHNTFLEPLLATGLLGAVPFLLLISYSLKWFTRFFEMCRSFSLLFTLRAIAVITVILSSTMTESDLATKIGPVMIVFLFYVLALDRQGIYAE